MIDGRLYDVLAVLRGPDSENIPLKVLFTLRVRHIVFGDDCLFCRKTKKINFADVLDALCTVTKYDYHYLAHVLSALDSLHSLRLIDKDEYEMLYDLADAYDEIAMAERYEEKAASASPVDREHWTARIIGKHECAFRLIQHVIERHGDLIE